VKRLNTEDRGQFLGDFQPADKILTLLNTGEYKLIGFDLSTHFEDSMIHLEKWIKEKPLSVVHYDGEKEAFFVKRFLVEASSKKVSFITEHENSRLEAISTAFYPIANLRFNKKFKKTRDKKDEQIKLDEFISVKGLKALGNKLHALPVTEVSMLEVDVEKEAEALSQLTGSKLDVDSSGLGVGSSDSDANAVGGSDSDGDKPLMESSPEVKAAEKESKESSAPEDKTDKPALDEFGEAIKPKPKKKAAAKEKVIKQDPKDIEMDIEIPDDEPSDDISPLELLDSQHFDSWTELTKSSIRNMADEVFWSLRKDRIVNYTKTDFNFVIKIIERVVKEQSAVKEISCDSRIKEFIKVGRSKVSHRIKSLPRYSGIRNELRLKKNDLVYVATDSYFVCPGIIVKDFEDSYRVIIFNNYDDELTEAEGKKINGWEFRTLLNTEIGETPEEAIRNRA